MHILLWVEEGGECWSDSWVELKLVSQAVENSSEAGRK